jgi:hypothetical protein
VVVAVGQIQEHLNIQMQLLEQAEYLLEAEGVVVYLDLQELFHMLHTLQLVDWVEMVVVVVEVP